MSKVTIEFYRDDANKLLILLDELSTRDRMILQDPTVNVGDKYLAEAHLQVVDILKDKIYNTLYQGESA